MFKLVLIVQVILQLIYRSLILVILELLEIESWRFTLLQGQQSVPLSLLFLDFFYLVFSFTLLSALVLNELGQHAFVDSLPTELLVLAIRSSFAQDNSGHLLTLVLNQCSHFLHRLSILLFSQFLVSAWE
jgi:hypothetical protein